MNLKENRVYALECDRYEVNLIKEKLKEGLELWGGLENFVKPDQTVLLKANLLMAKKPEDSTTTHPAVVHAVTEMVEEVGGNPIIGDSPGGPFNTGMLKRIYSKTGMEAIADSTGAELNWNFESVSKTYSEGKVLKNMTLGQFITDVDLIINLPKFKTHGLTKMTGAVKNMFGAIPGLLKGEYHLNMHEVDIFSEVLLDIALACAPTLSIMDGIVGMEGEGPSGGDSIELNTLLISPNPCALDVAMAHLVKIEPEEVPTIKAAQGRGLVSTINEIEIIGKQSIDVGSFTSPDIENSTLLIDNALPAPLAKIVQKLLRPKPIFNAELCVQCGDCIRSCPPQIITKTEDCVEADLDECIRCFCCQELCPRQAVDIHRPFLGRLLFGN